MTSLFISDLHLHEKRPLITEAFFSFLQREASRASCLYILGDLFDTWIGDDDDSTLAHDVAERLSTLARQGVRLGFQHGNRDFLLGASYARRCSMELLPELHVIILSGYRCLLAHGDQFCTNDLEYQKFRHQVRNQQWQSQLLSKPLGERRAIAEQLRETSREANSLKAEDIMDVTPSEVIRAMENMNCTRLIHGHTHRPAQHTLTVRGVPGERVVLGDWDSRLWYLRADERSWQLLSRDLN